MSAKITSTDFHHDISPWCCEKTEYLLRSLSRTTELVKLLPENYHKEFFEELRADIFNAIKLAAFSAGV